VIDVRDHRHVTDILVVIHLLAQLIDGKLERENSRQSSSSASSIDRRA
jgi:hypothetical protein